MSRWIKALIPWMPTRTTLWETLVTGPLVLLASPALGEAYYDYTRLGYGVEILPVSGFVGPVPPIDSNCLTGANNTTPQFIIPCKDTSLLVSCSVGSIITSAYNVTTGKSLSSSTEYLAVNVGSYLYVDDAIWGRDAPPNQKPYMCTAHVGETAPIKNSSVNQRSIVYYNQGFTTGDQLRICTQDRWANMVGYWYNSPHGYVTGESRCTIIGTRAPTCSLVGPLSIDLGVVGSGGATVGTALASMRCPSPNMVSLQIAYQTADNRIVMSNTVNGSEVYATLSMQIDNGNKVSGWTGIVNGASDVLFTADISDAGNQPGIFEGNVIVLLNNQ